MRITLGTGVTRAGADETIAGLWTFANVLGLLTDIIGERTAAAGVTVDGLLIRDAGIPEAAVTAHEAALAILESQIADGTILARLAAAEFVTGGWTFNSSVNMRSVLEMLDFGSASNAVFRTNVVGDSDKRFALHVNGIMQWGDGFSARDTNLFRSAANVLRTDDSFRVGTTLQIDGVMVANVQETALSSQTNNFDLGLRFIQRFTLSATLSFTGMVAAVADQIVYLVNADDASTLNIQHENAASAAANRFALDGDAILPITFGQAFGFWYDGTSSRWRQLTS